MMIQTELFTNGHYVYRSITNCCQDSMSAAIGCPNLLIHIRLVIHDATLHWKSEIKPTEDTRDSYINIHFIVSTFHFT